jgi:hypothetical protein
MDNHNFNNYVHLIYPDGLEIKDTTESDKSALYLAAPDPTFAFFLSEVRVVLHSIL